MTNRLRSAIGLAGAALTVTVLLAGCEELVYRDRELFNPPPDSVSGFLGYFNAAEKQTTCGNCHKGKQAEWSGTKHSHAWKDLQESGEAKEACEPCHTVTERGNIVAVAAGFNAVKDSAYHDVQCENCHGPGASHLQGPETIQPLPSIAVDTGLTNGCGECHSGSQYPFADEWAKSAHGYGGGKLFVGFWNRAPCKNCHEGREALRVNFEGFDPRDAASVGGPAGVYLEASAGAAGAQPQVCAVCHDPHDATNDHQLRGPDDEPELEHVCVHCHRREGSSEIGVSSRRGPHAAQGLINIDEDVGWKPPSWPYTERLLPTHAGRCPKCHMAAFDIKDAAGNFVKRYTGHLFEPIPCIDQTTGEPVRGVSCSDDERYFGGCAVSGCHSTATRARTAFEVLEGRMDYLTDQLWTDDGDGVMETTDRGVLPQVLAKAIAANNLDEINLYDTRRTDAEAAIWNAQLAASDERSFWFNFKVQGQNSCNPASTSSSDKCPGTLRSNTAHRSSGGGVHNPFLLEALLIETIKAIQTTYGLAPNPSMDLTVHATPPPGVSPIK